MLSEKQLFLVIAIVCLFLLIIFKLVKSQTEGFDGVETPPSNVCSNSKNWWEKEVPKQVVSYVSGVRFPIHAIDPTNAIQTLFQVPYIKSGETDASGCLSIEMSGTYTTKMCNADSAEQRWKLVQVKDKTIFSNLLQSGKTTYSGINQNYDTPASGIPFGFFMVISDKDPSMVLASNGGNLTVQRVGNYTSQFWDITKDSGNANIAIYDTNDLTNLGSNYTNPQYVIPLEYIKANLLTRKNKDKFCCIVFNSRSPHRCEIIEKLGKYKKVDCYGKPFGNWFYGEDNKLKTISDYKFNICFENSISPGYYTEKMIHAKTAGCLPIYWADNNCHKDFNPRSFLNLYDLLQESRNLQVQK